MGICKYNVYSGTYNRHTMVYYVAKIISPQNKLPLKPNFLVVDVNYKETFAPVAKMNTIRVLLSYNSELELAP